MIAFAPLLALSAALLVNAQDNTTAIPAPPAPTVSSNVTLLAPTATATLDSTLPKATSVPYVWPNVDLTSLPAFTWDLSRNDEKSRSLLCEQQVTWCSKAGCAEPQAKVVDNFCEEKTMGTRCTCDKGASNLQQQHWPVSSTDCSSRNTVCVNSCQDVNVTPSAKRGSCIESCNTVFKATCGMPAQFNANYAISKRGQTPSYAVIQGGDAAIGAGFTLRSSLTLAAAVAAGVSLFALL